MLIDDNGITCFWDDYYITCFVDDNGLTLCCSNISMMGSISF